MTRVGDRFTIDREIGRGGMGAVYRARDEQTGEVVALKRMLSHGVDAARFVREAKVLSRLSHPRVVGYVAHGEDEQGPWLAMEWIAGRDLAAVTADERPSLGRALFLIAQLCEAVAAAHAIGIVHRDVKPSNIVVVGDGAPDLRVVDFGIARDLDASIALTFTGAMIGTPLYMSPEQLRGEPATYASDVYAIGCVAFELLAGRPPHVSDSPFAAIGRILLEPTPRLERFCPDVPVAIADAIDRALSKVPADRPRAHELAEFFLAQAEDVATIGSARTLAQARSVDLGHEQRSAAVVVVRRARDRARVQAQLAKVATAHDALPDGAVLGLVTDASSPDAPLLRAVRFGLSVRDDDPDAVIVVAMGKAGSASSGVAGDALERAASIRIEDAGVHVDLDSARLLDERFALLSHAHHATVLGEAATSGDRLLLGKPTPTVGRDAEISQLQALVDGVADDGAPRVAFVIAPAGQGKSRVRAELIRRLSGRPALVARFEPASDGTAWGGLARGLRDAAGIVGPDGRAKLAAWCNVDASHASFLAEITGVASDEDARVLDVARGSPQMMRDGVHDAMQSLLRRLAGDDVVLLMLEDAHWADGATLALVDDVAARADVPVAIVLFARPELLERNPELCRRRAPLRLDLRAIPARAMTRLVRSVLPPETPDADVQRIVELGAGNPLVTEELVRAFVATGRLTPSVSAQAVFEARVGRLATRERLVARTAALIGEVFWIEAVATLLAPTGVDIDDAIATLEREELVAKSPTTRFHNLREYAFRHALLRDAAAATVPDDARRELHAGIARWLLGVGEHDLAAVAQHAERGGQATLAGTLLEEAGLAAAAAHDVTTSSSLLEHALRLLPRDHPNRPNVHLALERNYRWTAQPRRRMRHLVAFRRSAPRDEEHEAMFLLGEARLRLDRMELEACYDTARRALAAARSAGALDAVAEATLILVEACRELGRIDEALELLAAVDGTFPPMVMAQLLRGRGILMRRRGRLREAIDLYEQAVAIFERAGLRVPIADSINALGYALFVDGQLARAREHVERSIAMRRAMGVVRGLPKTITNLGAICAAVGDWRGAAAKVDEALEAHRVYGERDALADSTIVRARIAIELGELAEAERRLDDARRLVEASRNNYDRAHLDLVHGWFFARREDWTRAAECLERSHDVATRAGLSAFALAAYAELGRARLHLGERERAVEIARETLRGLEGIDASEFALETFDAVLFVLHADAQWGDAARRARQWVAAMRAKIGDDALVQAFDARDGVRRIDATA